MRTNLPPLFLAAAGVDCFVWWCRWCLWRGRAWVQQRHDAVVGNDNATISDQWGDARERPFSPTGLYSTRDTAPSSNGTNSRVWPRTTNMHRHSVGPAWESTIPGATVAENGNDHGTASVVQ